MGDIVPLIKHGLFESQCSADRRDYECGTRSIVGLALAAMNPSADRKGFCGLVNCIIFYCYFMIGKIYLNLRIQRLLRIRNFVRGKIVVKMYFWQFSLKSIFLLFLCHLNQPSA